MIVKCKSSFRHQITEGDNYLVIEVLIRRTTNRISYRIIDNEGYPAIYEADKFEVISNKLIDFAIKFDDEIIILSHTLILNSELNKMNIEGFWGLFSEDNEETKIILKRVLTDLSSSENIKSPMII